MSKKRSGPEGFRPHPEDQKRLDYLKHELQMNISKIIKDALTPYLDQNFEKIVDERKAELQKVIAAPVP